MGSMSLWHWVIVALVILVLFGRGKISEMMGDFGKGVSSFKKGLAEVVVAEFGPVRERALGLLDDPAELDRVLGANAARAAEVAGRTLNDVYDKVGLLRRA